MFYILSGFLIGGRTIQGISNNKVSPGRFAVNRIFRIGIPLFGAVMLTLCVNLVLNIHNNPIDIIGQFFGLQGILVSDYGGVFWTLPYEIWFYVLIFCIICFSVRKHILGGGNSFFLYPNCLFSTLTTISLYFMPWHSLLSFERHKIPS